MITQNFFSLAEGECGIPISFDEIFTQTTALPSLDSDGNPVLDVDGNPVITILEPTFKLTDSVAVILEFNVMDKYPEDTRVDIVPQSYEVQKPKNFIPQTTVKITSSYDFGAQILLQLNIKDRFGQVLYTDYQIIVIGDSQERNCKKTIIQERNNEDIILNINNQWKYIYNDHLIARLISSQDKIEPARLVGKLYKKNKDILPVRLSCENTGCEQITQETSGVCINDESLCRSKLISEIPNVSIIKRKILDSAHKIGDLIYKKNVYENDIFRLDPDGLLGIALSGQISNNIMHITGDYIAQHLLLYTEELPYINNVNILSEEDSDLLDGDVVVFNNQPYISNRIIAYTIGKYRLSVPKNISIALLNRGFEDKIHYYPINDGYIVTRSEVSNETSEEYIPTSIAGEYDFITGTMEIDVLDGVDDHFLSFYILNRGYLKLSHKFIYAKDYVPTPTPTPTPTVTPAATVTPTITPTITSTPTLTPTISLTPSSSPTQTPTATTTPSNTATITPTITNTPTPTITVSSSPTPSISPTNTPTISLTPSHSPTPSITPTNTPTISLTPSNTPTISITPSITPSNTPTISMTPTITPTFSPTPTITTTPSLTPTVTQTPSHTSTPTVTPSQNIDLPSKIQNLIATKNIDIENPEQNNIYLEWDEPLYSGTSNILSYSIIYQKISDSSSIRLDDIISTNHTILFDDPLDIEQEWIIQIFAKNSTGFGLHVQITV